MESRSSSVGESGGTGGYIGDESLEDAVGGGAIRVGTCDACPDCMDVCSLQST